MNKTACTLIHYLSHVIVKADGFSLGKTPLIKDIFGVSCWSAQALKNTFIHLHDLLSNVYA